MKDLKVYWSYMVIFLGFSGFFKYFKNFNLRNVFVQAAILIEKFMTSYTMNMVLQYYIEKFLKSFGYV